MTANEYGGLTIGVIFGLVLAMLWATRDKGADPKSAPPRPSMPSWCTEPQESRPLTYPVPRQALTTERLHMGPDQRAFEVDELRALWDASPDEPNARTDLRADPGPHEAA